MNSQISDVLSSAMSALTRIPLWTMRRLSAAADRLAAVDPTAMAGLLESVTISQVASAAQVRTAEGLRISTSPGAAVATLVEVLNKAEVYFLVTANQQVLGIPSPPPYPFPLKTYLDWAYNRDAYAALWAVEGLGAVFGESQLEAGAAPPTGLLCDVAAQTLPEKSLLMLHAGIGLAFAQKQLVGLPQRPSFADLMEAVGRFAELCRRNSRPGYMGAALEWLGMVTRLFYGSLVHSIDLAIMDTEPDLKSYFWHGVGRAIYFLPLNFLPCSTWETVLMGESEGVDEPSRLNLVAGVAWAIVMVNIRNPEVLANLVVEPHGERLLGNRGFRNGVISSLIMRQETTPGAPFIRSFLNYSDRYRRADRRKLWDALIRLPGEEALECIGPALKARQLLDQLFHFTSFPEPLPPRSGLGASLT